MSGAPKVSVVLCTYNRAGTIGKAVASALAQTYRDTEIVVMDDASTDATDRALSEFKPDKKVRVLKNKVNLGISGARNAGVAKARGAYIAMLDSDDYWVDPSKLEKQVSVLERDRKVGLVGTFVHCVDGDGRILKGYTYETGDAAIRGRILASNQFAQSTVLFRKNLFEKVGGYEEGLAPAEDLDLWLKLGLESEFRNIPEYSTRYLVHAGQASRLGRLKSAQAVATIIGRHRGGYGGYPRARMIAYARILRALWF